jgi:hypothetical protein
MAQSKQQHTQKKNKSVTTIARKIDLHEARADHYGLHGKDVVFHANKDSTIISVDPGHSTLISAVRRVGGNTEVTSQFNLKNTTWRSMNGSTRYQQSIQSMNMRMGVQKAIDILSRSSSRDVRHYYSHITARLETSSVMCSVMKLKNPRRWKFQAYKTEQRAVQKLVTDVLGKEADRNNSLVVWGNGSFGPTSKGYNSAPNKKMQFAIAQSVPIVLVNEFNTSKKTNCCKLDGACLRTKSYTKRTTVLQCPGCRRILARDTNAAMNILNVFIHQSETSSESVPSYLEPNHL